MVQKSPAAQAYSSPTAAASEGPRVLLLAASDGMHGCRGRLPGETGHGTARHGTAQPAAKTQLGILAHASPAATAGDSAAAPLTGSRQCQRDAGMLSRARGQFEWNPRPHALGWRSRVRHTRTSDSSARLHVTVIASRANWLLAR
jgi:hypothetical protein